ncbi:MAG: DUF1963 domain-containing protein [Bacteroidota bacterium]
MKEYFTINHINVGFADHPTEGTVFVKGALNTEVRVQKGKLRINLLTPELELTDELHNGLLNDPYFDNKRKVDYIRLVTYRDLAIPNGSYGSQITCPYEQGPTGFEVYGFPERVKFHGTIEVQEGSIHIQGEFRTEGNPISLPIEVVKTFSPKPLLPPRTVHTWEQALEQDPADVYELSIGKGIFPVFPQEILSFKNLESLWIGGQSQCRFSTLPEAFCSLTELRTLQIYGSSLEQLPKELGKLQKLEELTIQSSKLTELPGSICELKNVETISLRYNQLKTLPECISSLPNLKELDITSNNFDQLPPSLHAIEVLKVDRKYRKFFEDTSYKSENPHPIQEALYDLAAYNKERSNLAKVIGSKPKLKPFKDLILDYCTMATYLLMKEGSGDLPLGSSKVGGSPDLPKGWAHPANKNGHLYLFHAQINCEELAPFQSFLPRKGILYFFVNDEEYAQQAQVLYVEEAGELIRFSYTSGTEFIDSQFDDHIREAVGVHFENAISLPNFYNLFNHAEERYPKYAHLWKQAEEDEGLYDSLEPLEMAEELLEGAIKTPLGFDNGYIQLATHCINSSVFTQHESPQEQAAARFGGEPHEWMVLLNMESVGEFNFWDAGTLTYCIHKKDLAIQDFSTIYTSIESS